MSWPSSAAAWRPKHALAKGVVVRTNSRDTIHQAKLSPACDEPANVARMPYKRQLVGHLIPSLVGRLVRVEEAEGLIRP